MNNKLQLSTSNSQLPALNTPEDIAAVRLDERRYPRYGNVPQPARVKWLAEQAKTLAAIARIRDFDAKEAIATAVALDEMMTKNEAISALSIVEVAEVFKEGVFGSYGEFYGLSAPNLYGFLRSYLESEKKQAATAIVRKSYEERKKAEKDEMLRRIRAEIEEAKRNGSFVPTGRVWFQPRKVDDVLADDEHRKRVRAQAQEILRKC